MKRHTHIIPVAVLTGLLVVGISASATAQSLGPVHRFSAEFQFSPPGSQEISTTAAPLAGGAGGTVTYSKTLFVPDHTLYVTITATGDVHTLSPGTGAQSVSSLMMTCIVNGVVCNPGGGLDTAGPSGWVPMIKLPPPPAGSGCNPSAATGGPGDGGGGTADCHDNNFSYTWCTPIKPGPQTVQLKLASFPGGDGNTAFYERAHIYIDGTPNRRHGNGDDEDGEHGMAPNACVPAAAVH